MDIRHDVLAVHDYTRTFGRPQRHVQHGAIFRDVDLLASEHGVDARPIPDSSASLSSSLSVSLVMRFFE